MRALSTLVVISAVVTACNDFAAPRVERAARRPRRGNVATGGEVRAPDLPGFVEDSRYKQTGDRNARGQCAFRNTETLRLGERSAIRIVEFDPISCEFTVARGQLTEGLQATSRLERQSKGYHLDFGGEATSMSGPGTPEAPAEDIPISSPMPGVALQQLIAYDPFHIMLAEDGNTINYTWNTSTSCLTAAIGNHYTAWLAEDGWYRRYAYAFGGGLSCQSASGSTTSDSQTRSSVTSPEVCPEESPTWISRRTRSPVHPGDGNVTFQYYATKGGGCETYIGMTIERAA